MLTVWFFSGLHPRSAKNGITNRARGSRIEDKERDTFTAMTHAHPDVHHSLVRGAGMNQVRQGFPSARGVRRALAGLYHFDHTHTLDRRDSLHFLGAGAAMRLLAAFLASENGNLVSTLRATRVTRRKRHELAAQFANLFSNGLGNLPIRFDSNVCSRLATRLHGIANRKY